MLLADRPAPLAREGPSRPAQTRRSAPPCGNGRRSAAGEQGQGGWSARGVGQKPASHHTGWAQAEQAPPERPAGGCWPHPPKLQRQQRRQHGTTAAATAPRPAPGGLLTLRAVQFCGGEAGTDNSGPDHLASRQRRRRIREPSDPLNPRCANRPARIGSDQIGMDHHRSTRLGAADPYRRTAGIEGSQPAHGKPPPRRG